MRSPFRSPTPHGLSQLFEHGLEAYRAGNYFAALIIFDYLHRSTTLWKPRYWLWIRRCSARICEGSGKTPRLNTKKHTKRGIAMRLMDTLVSLGYPRQELAEAIESIPEPSNRSLLHACLSAGEDMTAWEYHLNQFLERHELRPFHLEGVSPGSNVLECLRFVPAPPAEDTGLVTVFISAFNSAATLPYAIESILRQDYPNFELIIADDASTDNTRNIIEYYAASDPRVMPLFNASNRGTYWNRNVALQKARGTYFTILDADDFCHPQRITFQIDMMRSNSNLAGVFSHWLRVERNGRLVFRNWGASYLHEAIATLLIDRSKVLPAIGYYDEVRFSADTEYVERIKRVFGARSVKVVRKPLTLALSHSASLTAEQTNGIHNYLGLSKPRREYRLAWKRWHDRSPRGELYIEFHAADRKFPAPDAMRIDRQ